MVELMALVKLDLEQEVKSNSRKLKNCIPYSPEVLWFVNGRERKSRKKRKLSESIFSKLSSKDGRCQISCYDWAETSSRNWKARNWNWWGIPNFKERLFKYLLEASKKLQETRSAKKSVSQKSRQNIIKTNGVDAFHNNQYGITVVYLRKGLQGKQMLISS